MNAHTRLAGDIPLGNWVDRYAPTVLRPYLRLSRLDRPIGTWLLLLPGWWSLALSSKFWPDSFHFLLFALGATVMRGAGCTFNDIIDRDFDGKVARTAARPIPSGDVSLAQASAWLLLQLLVGLLILAQFNNFAIAVGAASLGLIFPYPFMKRITYWPQAWLGLTFNWGALLGWAATTGQLESPAFLLYSGGLFWTLGYDTIYAHQDKEDDALVGVKSTALRLGDATPLWLVLFYGAAWALFCAAGWAGGEHWPFFLLMGAAAAQLGWQIRGLDLNSPLDCLEKFKSNRSFGLIVLAALCAGKWG